METKLSFLSFDSRNSFSRPMLPFCTPWKQSDLSKKEQQIANDTNFGGIEVGQGEFPNMVV